MRVVIADESSLFRDGIASLLETAGHEMVEQTRDGVGAVEAVLRLRPDLVLMDAALPEMDGVTATAKIKAEAPDTKVVILTGVDDDETLYAAIRAGADGYLSKDLKATEFFEMLSGLSRGDAAITRRTAARLMDGFQKVSRMKNRQDRLTRQETRVLTLMGKGSSNKVIAEALFISENTVKYHVRNILNKLGVKNRTEAVVQALRENLIDKD